MLVSVTEATRNAGSVSRTGNLAVAAALAWASVLAFIEEGLTSSSQTSMCLRPVIRNYPSVAREHQALVDSWKCVLLHLCIEAMRRLRPDAQT